MKFGFDHCRTLNVFLYKEAAKRGLCLLLVSCSVATCTHTTLFWILAGRMEAQEIKLSVSSLGPQSNLVRGQDQTHQPQNFPLWLSVLPTEALGVKNPPTDAGDVRDTCSIPASGRSPGGSHGNPLPYSCLEDPTDRGALRTTVHGVTKSRTWPRD